MIEGLLLNNSGRNASILAPTPIKLQKHMVTASSMATPTMISSTSYSTPNSTTTTTSSNPSPTVDWTHERIMCLIKLYEKKSVLWNPSNPEYFHRDIRNMVYDDLVRELNIPELTVNETKRKLENLRSYFRRETKKLQDHERKTSEKLLSRWPYYESLQFIHEFMSVKNEAGSELGFSRVNKSLSSRNSYQLPTMKREPVSEECAVQVPIGSTPLDTGMSTGAFQLASTELVAVLKALQGPLAETAASCFGISPDIPVNNTNNNYNNNQGNGTVNGSSPTTTLSPKSLNLSPNRRDLIEQGRSTPITPLQNHLMGTSNKSECGSPPISDPMCKKRKLYEREPSARSTEELADTDLCRDYGRTVAHQLRQMGAYERDLCRLQIDQLIFNLMHKDQKKDLPLPVQNGIAPAETGTPEQELETSST